MKNQRGDMTTILLGIITFVLIIGVGVYTWDKISSHKSSTQPKVSPVADNKNSANDDLSSLPKSDLQDKGKVIAAIKADCESKVADGWGKDDVGGSKVSSDENEFTVIHKTSSDNKQVMASSYCGSRYFYFLVKENDTWKVALVDFQEKPSCQDARYKDTQQKYKFESAILSCV